MLRNLQQFNLYIIIRHFPYFMHESHFLSPLLLFMFFVCVCVCEAVFQSLHVHLVRRSRLFDENIQLNV